MRDEVAGLALANENRPADDRFGVLGYSTCENDFRQTLHVNGRSPLCTRACRSRSDWHENAFGQSGQTSTPPPDISSAPGNAGMENRLPLSSVANVAMTQLPRHAHFRGCSFDWATRVGPAVQLPASS